jgi:hypothetical protein
MNCLQRIADFACHIKSEPRPSDIQWISQRDHNEQVHQNCSPTSTFSRELPDVCPALIEGLYSWKDCLVWFRQVSVDLNAEMLLSESNL